MRGLRVVELPVDELWRVWETYAAEIGVPSPFQTPQFAQCWLHNLGISTTARPLGVYSNDRIVGLFPLVELSPGPPAALSVMGDIDTADYLDCMVAEHPEEVWHAVIVNLAERNPVGFTLHCQGVPATSPTLSVARRVADRLGLSFHERSIDVAPTIDLPSSWAEYLTLLGKHDRHELRRKFRRAEANGKLDLHLDISADPQALDNFLRLLRLSSPEKQAYMTPPRERFFRCFAQGLADRSALRLYTLYFNDRAAASIFCIEMNHTLYLYNSGYDPAFGSLSLGLLLVALSIKDAIERGVKRYDFLRGNERYKYDLGGRDGQIIAVILTATQAACQLLRERTRYSLC